MRSGHNRANVCFGWKADIGADSYAVMQATRSTLSFGLGIKLAPMVLAMIVPLLPLLIHGDGVDLIVGPAALLYWPIIFAWAASLGIALPRGRSPWLLSTALLALYPLCLALAVVAACEIGPECI